MEKGAQDQSTEALEPGKWFQENDLRATPHPFLTKRLGEQFRCQTWPMRRVVPPNTAAGLIEVWRILPKHDPVDLVACARHRF